MDQKKEITVNIINRNYPPYRGITGESASELAEFLSNKGIKINVVHVAADYSGSPDVHRGAGTRYVIKTFYNGKNVLLRLLSSLYEGFRLAWKSHSLKPDVTICMTDPPLLNMWAVWLRPKTPLVFWTMDLYPEGFWAGGLLSKKNFFYRFVDRIVLRRAPDHLIALGPCQQRYLQGKYNKQVPTSILPCGIYLAQPHSERPDWASDTNKIVIGYCGNLGEAHSYEYVKLAIDAFDPEKHTFILSTYGTKAERILTYAKSLNKKGLIILPSVSRSNLRFIDVHLASLSNEWVNVSVPSKTVSSVCAGSTFVYYGVKNSDNWELLKDAGWLIENSRDPNAITDFLKMLDVEKIREKKLAATRLAKQLNDLQQASYLDIYTRVVALGK